MPLHPNYRFFCRSIFSLFFLATINAGIPQAQITPDGTLPTSVQELENMKKITGGKQVGNNLFHSFEKFSIPTGTEAIFENAPDIQNIFTRITGNEASFIDGLLQTQGGANFFLVNPNGIVFGENAVIDVGGSFVATTADTIEFADGTSFAARNPNVSLTISVPIGLGLYGNNGSITVKDAGNQITNDSNFLPIEFGQRPTGISAPDGQTIGLIGNGINLNGGVVTTEGGNIFLTSVESGSVGIGQTENGLTLLNDQVNNYQDINLNEQSLIDASGEKVGKISLSGQNINLRDGSVVLSQNQGNLPGGSIDIQASESITFSGTSPNGEIASIIRTESLSDTGEGSDLNISANELSLQDTSKIQAFTFSEALGGNVKVKTHEAVTLNNSLINAGTRGEGNSGNLELSTSQLTISDGGIITTSTFSTGNGGEVSIEADLIEVIGNTNVSRGSRSNISASSFSSSQDRPGNAGNLNINTQQLRIKDGGAVSSSSFGTGNGGNISINASELITVSGKDNNTSSRSPESTIRTAVQIGPSGRIVPTGTAGSLTINTPVLNVTQEGVISVENQGTGSAGTLTINADNLSLDGMGNITAAAESGLGGNIELNTQNLNITNDSQITASAGGNENGGNITINTTNLTAKKNNQITASTVKGDGGNIDINAADSVSLSLRDSISATSEAGEGGNITIDTSQLRLENNSSISTSAGGLGDGGNITINSDIFTAFNSSQVTANAFQGSGGNILINTTGYFVSDDFIISASSEFGLDGTVEINAPDNDFQKDLELSQLEVVSLPDFFTPRCQNPDRARLNIGTGQYLPAQPNNYSSSQTRTLSAGFPPELEKKLDRFKRELESNSETEKTSNVFWQVGQPIVNSTKIVRTEDGRVFLVAPEATPETNKTSACVQG